MQHRTRKPQLNLDKLATTFLGRCKNLPPLRTAIVHPCSPESLIGTVQAAKLGLIDPILVGNANKIKAIAKKHHLAIANFPIVHCPHSHAAAERAVAMAKEQEIDALMKGSLHTDELMSIVIKKENGLRTERRISHVFAMTTPYYPKPFFITDAVINITPDLLIKQDIIQNAIDLVHVLKINRKLPKVAILSAIEMVNPAIQSTIDAASLCKMADRGQIQGAILDGPLAYDNALSLKAAKIKGIRSEVAGVADIILVPELESGNMLYKQLVLMADAVAAGIVLGAKVPIILTSRSDDKESRIASCALALLLHVSKQAKKLF